ncbi:hypothetical protein PENSPDRAFT_611012 [Peniophora sp. CONT]|nr:hypothetical protein PENSPDRAFT_611012 [Peniophora sp. CONT]
MVLQPYNARQRRTRNVSNVENRKPAVVAPTQPYPKRKRAGRVPGSIRNLHDNKRRVSTANKLLVSAAASRAGSIGQTPEFVPMEVDMTTIPSPFTAGNITLPRHLAHPLVKTPRPECLRAQGIDPNVDLLYTRNIFRTVGPKMWRTLTSMSISTVAKQRGLPRAVDLTVNDCSGEIPTHCLAVWPLDRQQGQQDLEKALPVTLYPVHGSVLAINAAHLPVLPAGTPAAPRTRGSRMQVPVVSLAVPAPNAFNPLLRYMYTKDHNALFASFFPAGAIPSVATTPREQVLAGAETLARMVPRSVLFRIASGLTGLWRNTCFLGVFDDALWATMDLAWEVTLSALAMSAPEPIPFA